MTANEESEAPREPPALDRPAGEPISWSVDEPSAGLRVDAALASVAEVSRAEVQRWITAGRVRVGGRPLRASRRLSLGERIEAWPIEPVAMELVAESIPLVVLHEDAQLIVVDKPAGLVVHPAPGHPHGTLVNALLGHCGDLAGIGGVLRPGVVHRLDRGTSGVMVVAKTDPAHRHLSAQFAEHSVERRYRTFVRGMPGAEAGVVDRPIGRHPRDRKRMSVEAAVGREAVTRWRVVRRYPEAGVSELEIRPLTGRTHQIRVHLAASGLPILGDAVYGRARGADARPGRPALHAERLGFVHPTSGVRMRFTAPLPADLVALAASLGPGIAVETAGGPAEEYGT